MDDEQEVRARLAAVRDRIAEVSLACGRDPAEVALLLATKTVPAERILPAIRAGGTLIGENRVQELVAKADALSTLPHETHLIGHLQRNKVNQALRVADCIQSVDSRELADAIADRVPPQRRPLDVFVQVNTSGEESKFGCTPADATALTAYVAARPELRLRGFMTIGLFSDDHPAVRASYRRLREVRDKVAASGAPGTERARELSMGMSGDLHLAIPEGATMVRVGTAVFGTRPTSDSYYWPPS